MSASPGPDSLAKILEALAATAASPRSGPEFYAKLVEAFVASFIAAGLGALDVTGRAISEAVGQASKEVQRSQQTVRALATSADLVPFSASRRRRRLFLFDSFVQRDSPRLISTRAQAARCASTFLRRFHITWPLAGAFASLAVVTLLFLIGAQLDVELCTNALLLALLVFILPALVSVILEVLPDESQFFPRASVMKFVALKLLLPALCLELIAMVVLCCLLFFRKSSDGLISEGTGMVFLAPAALYFLLGCLANFVNFKNAEVRQHRGLPFAAGIALTLVAATLAWACLFRVHGLVTLAYLLTTYFAIAFLLVPSLVALPLIHFVRRERSLLLRRTRDFGFYLTSF